jgi:hypothetical protein
MTLLNAPPRRNDHGRPRRLVSRTSEIFREARRRLTIGLISRLRSGKPGDEDREVVATASSSQGARANRKAGRVEKSAFLVRKTEQEMFPWKRAGSQAARVEVGCLPTAKIFPPSRLPVVSCSIANMR